MGKKKSVVLMTLLTIVMVVLCFVVAFPSFVIPGTSGVKKWNPIVKQYDLGTDLAGGYYTYYYPEGVITETDYNNLTEKQQEDYFNHGGLYLDKDEDLGIIELDDNGEEVISEDFKVVFSKAKDVISARYAARYSDYSVSVVDDYSLRIVLPSSEVADGEASTASQNAFDAVSKFALTGELTIEKGGELIDEMKEDELKASSLIKKVEVKSEYETAYLRIQFTNKGEKMIKAFKSENKADSNVTLTFKIGDVALSEISITADHISKGEVKYYMQTEWNQRYVETYAVLMNSAINNGTEDDIAFRAPKSSEMRAFEPVYGDNVLTLLYIALAIVIVALIVFAIVKMNKFGVVSAYLTVLYFLAAAICFAFITRGILEITVGSAVVFLAGLLLVNALHAHIFNAIKAEFALGKTVESSVKGGFKKTIWTIVDIYAVLLLGGIAFLFGSAALHTLAIQMIICTVAGAFCNLLMGRAINCMMLSASKNKYKYFRFVREDDDDE